MCVLQKVEKCEERFGAREKEKSCQTELRRILDGSKSERESKKKTAQQKKSKQQHNVTCETNILVLYRKNKEHKRHTHRKEEEQDS